MPGGQASTEEAAGGPEERGKVRVLVRDESTEGEPVEDDQDRANDGDRAGQAECQRAAPPLPKVHRRARGRLTPPVTVGPAAGAVSE